MIKMLVSIAGKDAQGKAFSASPGEKISLDKDFEKRLIESGQAETVKTVKKAAKK